MTLPELLDAFRRRAVEAASVGATAPVAAIYEAVLAELLLLSSNGNGHANASLVPPARQLTAREAAPLLGVTPRWLYRRRDTLPFARRLGLKTVRFDEAGLRAWLARRA